MTNRHSYVPPTGPPDAKIVLIGEQPGKREVAQRKPFVGPAGRELNDCLNTAGIARHDCYLTNVVKDLDAPIKNYVNITGKKATVSAAGRQYIDELRDELNQLSANVLVAIGNVALFALTDRVGITKWRGSVIQSELCPQYKVVPVIHPATIIPPKMVYLNKHLLIHDLQLALRESEFPQIKRAERTYLVGPSFFEAQAFLRDVAKAGLDGATVCFDIEIHNLHLSCISFVVNDNVAMSIPFIGPGGDYFTVDQEADLMKQIAQILETPAIKKCGQNVIFDASFLLRRYGIKTHNLDDTMIAQQIIAPDFPKGLDFITSMWTDMPYYKDEGKQWFKVGGKWETLWEYNARDSIACAIALPKQLDELEQMGNTPTYERQSRLIEPLTFMMEFGIKANVDGMQCAYDSAETRIAELQEDLNELAGHQLNPNSPKQLKDYFYIERGVQPYRKGGKPTTNDDALKRLSRRGFKEASVIQEMRRLNKQRANYLDTSHVDSDGRIRCSYNPVGTRYSRISSSKNIFGTGMNLQNWPHSMLKYLVADTGYIYYSFDLSQFENRIVAYVGNVTQMIEAFESDTDVHSLTASLIFGKPPDEVTHKDGTCPIGDGTHSERFWGKKCNHCALRTCEVLTKSGWVGIEQAYIESLSIAQWETSGKITFVHPSDWFVDTYTGDIHTISNQRIFQERTPEHKMPVLYKSKIKDKEIRNYPHSGKYLAPLSGSFSGNYTVKKEFLQLLVAFQADGSWNGRGVRYRFSKDRKIERLQSILTDSGVTYNNPQPGSFYLPPDQPFVELARMLLGAKKLFGPWLLELDGESLDTIIDEVPLWDGHVRATQKGVRTSYFATIKQNAEWIQTICHLRNRACNIGIQDNSKAPAFGDKTLYRVNIRSTDAPATSAINRSTRYVEDEPILCPTVPSGYFMCREDGRISVTGNSLNYDMGYKTFALVFEMPERDAKLIIEKYHAAYPGVRQTFHAHVRRQLSIDRTLTNLMGRRTKFLGRWDDKLFKEAYSCIPQGTCGDVINERGINFIYYNPQTFSPAQLLTQVHDSVGFQLPLSLPWIEHARLLNELKRSLEQPLEWHSRKFVVPVDLSMGLNMGEVTELSHKKWPATDDELAIVLAHNYDQLLNKPAED